MRIPKSDDPFFVANAARMYLLLNGAANHPFGVPLNKALVLDIEKLLHDAYLDGIDIVGVSQGRPPIEGYDDVEKQD